ncbi:MAG: hypothetical protein EZS28_012797 [Streblomastix strix]|uniref:Uncharacterized protein n=1 Tax=Streblomastix strix TaxID=222440 RepID=A0A5J4WAI6_9EUKA|nr:MAG: hypothetical protein EZS28_012797 [Streblomastix strix]
MKLVITNNRFTNCFGYYAGALHNALQTVNCNISNNEFSGNGKYGLDQKGSDAYLQWISKLSGWTAENTHNKIMIMLNGSKSTNIDSISYQISLNSGFINLPKEWAYCVAKDQLTVKCICNPDSTSYLFEICQKYKLCQFDLIHQTTQDCPCLISGDPRAGIICPAYCVKDSTTPEYVCDANISNYSVEQCQQEKLYKYDLIHQTVANCPCLSTGDPRAGGICPAYCTSKDIPTSDCVCDSNSTIYHRSTCQFEKQYCQINSNSSVQKDSCICTGTNYPYGCKCPTDPTQLSSIPQNRCECRSWGDPRAGKGECPAYCIKGQTTSNCVCETGSSMYPQSVCEKDKLCFDDLVHQTKANCQCLMKGDSRAGGICPSYCKSKDELTVNCMCELDSSYPQATCEKDKLCIVDLIHQSTSNCPCLSANDPRGESVCKQTDIDPSDPDPTDPVIPDPSEQDPETDQEQEQDDGIKQQFDDEDQSEIQNEQSSAFQMIWIIYIAVGALFVVVNSKGNYYLNFGRREKA